MSLFHKTASSRCGDAKLSSRRHCGDGFRLFQPQYDSGTNAPNFSAFHESLLCPSLETGDCPLLQEDIVEQRKRNVIA